jgi:hypothetical protein
MLFVEHWKLWLRETEKGIKRGVASKFYLW